MILGLYNPFEHMSHRKGFSMSDNFAMKRYHRQTVSVVGIKKKKKFLVIFAVLLLLTVAGLAYVVYSSGVLAEDNPKIAPQLALRINQERYLNNLEPVQVDHTLSAVAYAKSQEVKISRLNYGQGSATSPDDSTDIFIIPKMTWALSGYDFMQQMMDLPENSAFRKNILNPKYRSIGFGITSDSYNYIIVTTWNDG
jgi:hypothetical protein